MVIIVSFLMDGCLDCVMSGSFLFYLQQREMQCDKKKM